ncbi:MAG: hypothetical protein KDC83_05340 [Flavobacteriales bacterium]|nr:hypothetical protein [Flavobacteriales bacterium]
MKTKNQFMQQIQSCLRSLNPSVSKPYSFVSIEKNKSSKYSLFKNGASQFNFLALQFIALFILFAVQSSQAQWVLVNQNGGSPDSSAAIEIESTTKGMLIPRLTTSQMNAVSSPATGLLVFNSTEGGFYFYNGSSWLDLSEDNLGDHTATQNIKLNDNYLSNDGDNEGIRIDNTGNVGFGITSPEEKIHLAGNIKFLESSGGNITVDNRSTNAPGSSLGLAAGSAGCCGFGYPGGSLYLSAGDGYGAPGFGQGGGVLITGGGNTFGPYDPGDIEFRTRTGTSTITRMVVDGANGNVGIGTSSPSEELDVEGDIQIDGDYTYESAKTSYMSFHSSAFEISTTNQSVSAYRQYLTSGTTGVMRVGTQGGLISNDAYLIAPVHLPHGATVTEVSALVYDANSTYNAQVRLVNQLHASGFMAEMSNASSVGNSGNQTLVDNTIANATIDNSSKVYSLIFETKEALTTIQLASVRITYTITKAQ